MTTTLEEYLAELNGKQLFALVLKLWNDFGGKKKGAEHLDEYRAGKVLLKLENKIQLFFDRLGRGIPTDLKGVVDANREFHLVQPPQFDYAAILARLQGFFGTNFKFMTAEDFEKRCLATIEMVKNDLQIANLLYGPHFPFALPQLAGDLGQLIDGTIVPALERSYHARFPEQEFTNHHHGKLVGRVTVVAGVRQERLVEAMAQGPVCGIYFPVALQGFDIEADREFISRLPECLILSGLEALAAAIAYPEVFGRDYHTPILDMAALQWRSSKLTLNFGSGGADDNEAHFGGRDLCADEVYSGGVSVLG